MLEECRLRLILNSDARTERRGPLCGLRRGGGIPPGSTKRSAVRVAGNRPAAAFRVLVRGSLNVSNLQMIPADATLDFSAGFALPRLHDRTDRKKSADRKLKGCKTKPNRETVKRLNILPAKGLSPRSAVLSATSKAKSRGSSWL